MPRRRPHAARHAFSAGSALSLLAALLLSGPASHAVAGGTFELTATCNPDGSPSTHVTITEHFTGLQATSGYRAYATRTVDNTTIAIEDGTTYWEPAADGTRDFTGDGDTGHLSETVSGGDGYHWVLWDVGLQQEVLSGDIAVEGDACGPPPPPGGTLAPHRASFAHSPAMLRVDRHGGFRYRFDAGKGLHGTIAVARKGTTVAHLGFVVPANGTERPVLKLTAKALHRLRALGKATYKVTVVVHNSAGSASAHTSLVLKKPT